jgi:hypothetical protein
MIEAGAAWETTMRLNSMVATAAGFAGEWRLIV